MKPVYQSDRVTVWWGDSLDVMPHLDQVDAVVTDPPYGLSFMGRDWDHGVPGPRFWEAAMGAMKPGAHLVAFGGTRTFHRLAVSIEDGGLDIRDCLSWIYGSGFPKSLDVSKAIDKQAGAEREVVGKGKWTAPKMEAGKGISGLKQAGSFAGEYQGERIEPVETAPATDQAKAWNGWGTALKPAWEPIILARKPLDGTVASNVVTHGTGAINVDGCRVGTDDEWKPSTRGPSDSIGTFKTKTRTTEQHPGGRWPANVILDDESARMVDEQSGATISRASEYNWEDSGNDNPPHVAHNIKSGVHFDDQGGASRFFYCAKADATDRGQGNSHPTVKPRDLMAWLIKLVTPAGATILDPFAGSGSTAVAGLDQSVHTILIEREQKYIDIILARLDQEEAQGRLF